MKLTAVTTGASAINYRIGKGSITVAQKKPDFYQYVLELGAEPEHFYKGFGPDFVTDYQWRFRPTASAYVVDEKSVKNWPPIR